jgi:predicted membrane protein DUF2306
MTILAVSAQSPALIRGAAEAILIVHVGAAAIALLSGAAALSFRKGERPHRIAGNVFFVSMLLMAGIGASVSPFLPQPQWGSTLAGVLTCYLVATSWVTVRRKEGCVGRFETGALFVVVGVAIAEVTLGLRAAHSSNGFLYGAPMQAYFVFGSLAALAAGLDLNAILRRGLSGAHRIARHLWRMCTALLIAAFSFFLGQQQVFPASIRGSSLLFVPEIVVLCLLIFWLARVLFTRAFKDTAEFGVTEKTGHPVEI